MNKLMFVGIGILAAQLSWAEGGSSSGAGGGGDAESLKFAFVARKAAKFIETNRSLFKEIDPKAFLKATEETKIVLTGDTLTDSEGSKKDALNYPEKGEIHLNRLAWRMLTGRTAAQIGLVVHEYLGILNIQDKNYRISSKVSDVVVDSKESIFRWSCAAVDWNTPVYGEGYTAVEAWKELNEQSGSTIVLYTSSGSTARAEPATMTNSCVPN